jgi:hypothetical protein
VPYASFVIGNPNNTAFENNMQKPIAMDSPMVQLKITCDPTTPRTKHKIAPKKKLNRIRQSNIVERSKFSMLKNRNIGIAMVWENFRIPSISLSLRILSLTTEYPPPTMIKTGRTTWNNE